MTQPSDGNSTWRSRFVFHPGLHSYPAATDVRPLLGPDIAVSKIDLMDNYRKSRSNQGVMFTDSATHDK